MKNPAFRQRRIINRLDSVTVCTVGVKCNQYPYLWQGKKVFVMATMGLFSGDGAGILARLLHKYGAEIIGGLHLKMPDSIADEKALKRSLEKNRELVEQAQKKDNTCSL